ncbi:hypothetical protein SISNIDRAFT_456087 [Sistotremastrum niveocremeum HHB9708]|uniref:BTB domain-containing protein n=1 Tax=Sistotremastrum niveocremeum HHB9708 TaxID=1314777 RepID=A0A164SXY6_9AGAM|nr:hypothetical protein SISNIDRAFT_456087 [Sistotremastrum niveocremeum HHB9708]
MSQDTPRLPSTSPHFAFPDSDITIRTCNFVDFRVHKCILSLASTVFRDMLSLDQISPQSSEAERKIVEVTENETRMELLLRYIYPSHARPVPRNLESMAVLLRLGDKYNTPTITSAMQEQLLHHPDLKSRPLRAFALCRKYNLDHVEAILVPQMLRDPNLLSDILTDRPPEDYAIGIEDMRRLAFYQRHRVKLAVDVLQRQPLPECPPCECRRDYFEVPEEGDYAPLMCSSWRSFAEICRQALSKDPNADITDAGLKKKACDAVKCVDAQDHLSNLYEHEILLAQQEIYGLPWIFADEFESHNKLGSMFEGMRRQRVGFDYFE